MNKKSRRVVVVRAKQLKGAIAIVDDE